MNTQVNITIPQHWKEQIDRLARKEAYEKNQNISYMDVIREAIRLHCNIDEDAK